jgi:hypothetical protein
MRRIMICLGVAFSAVVGLLGLTAQTAAADVGAPAPGVARVYVNVSGVVVKGDTGTLRSWSITFP